jgi:hypothetical protein
MGLSCPTKLATDSVAAIWLRLPPCRFDDFAGFRRPASPMPKHRQLPWAWIPSRAHRTAPAGDLTPRRPSWSFPPLQRHGRGGPLFPGFQPRYVPPSGFLTLLTVFSLHRFPATRTGTTRGVHPSELFPLTQPYAFRRQCPHAVSDIALFCSEDQKATMPRGSRVFLFVRIRTRPHRSTVRSMLSWVLRRLFRVRPERRRASFPTRSLMRFPRPPPRRRACVAPGHSRTLGLTRSRDLVDSPEVCHRDLSSGSPDDSDVPFGWLRPSTDESLTQPDGPGRTPG